MQKQIAKHILRHQFTEHPARVGQRVVAAVLDVTEKEPLPDDHPFWATPNLLLSFHTTAISYPENITDLFIENYQLYIEGKPLKHQVDFEEGY